MSLELDPLTGARHLQAMVRDALRIGALALLVVMISQLDVPLAYVFGSEVSAYQPVFTMLSVTAGICAFSHVTRRILFNQLDLQEIARRACVTPIGAALVFVGICFVLSVILFLNVLLLI